MGFKKLLSLALVSVMTTSLIACGKSEEKSGESNSKIVVWSLADDLKTFAEYYEEKNPGKEVEVTVIAPADYATKLTTALRGKANVPDIIVGEPQMLPNFFEAGFFEDLTQDPYNADEYKDKLVDYVYKAGSDEDGVLRALTYQTTPGGITYRRDIAKEVWGNDDPDFIAEKFKDVATIVETGRELKTKGYRVFTDTGSLRWFVYGNDAEPWVKDNKLMMTDSRLEYLDAAVTLYQDKLTAFAPEWSAAWYASMNGGIPVDAQWQELDEVDKNAEQTEVFSYALPTWGTLILRDNAKDTAGKFGVTTGPNSYFSGGTFIGISSYSQNKEAAWDFLKFCTLDEEVAQWWIEKSNGDVVALKSVLEANKDYENPALGGQKSYDFWLEEAEKVDYSLKTKYDDQIDKFFGQAIESVQKGEKTKEAGLKEFYNNVKTVYPEIEVPKN
ncbi:extracellular solute-binding protein [Clostridium sartagoforme]|uniref:Extracellular solute-binding protein n=1 Tax=Clostridium sartagoforme TaxID=84031 RepID=A0A4S2DJD5_9CLOT|nr:extracellular solute-binding protein [Clostridium sartagoforme]TGY42308.1 extracellular solute-binding protein [Clostridium sartagoforme]